MAEPNLRFRRSYAAALWVGLILASATLAPPTRPDVWAWCTDLVLGHATGTDPLVVTHFQLMGVWPLLFVILLRDDLRSKPVPAWPFVLGSFFLGAFALLPWFIVRLRSRTPGQGRLEDNLSTALLRGPVIAITVAWTAWGLINGDADAWLATWKGDGFVWIMALDFCALWLTSAMIVRERGGRWPIALLPIVGAALVG